MTFCLLRLKNLQVKFRLSFDHSPISPIFRDVAIFGASAAQELMADSETLAANTLIQETHCRLSTLRHMPAALPQRHLAHLPVDHRAGTQRTGTCLVGRTALCFVFPVKVSNSSFDHQIETATNRTSIPQCGTWFYELGPPTLCAWKWGRETWATQEASTQPLAFPDLNTVTGCGGGIRAASTQYATMK